MTREDYLRAYEQSYGSPRNDAYSQQVPSNGAGNNGFHGTQVMGNVDQRQGQQGGRHQRMATAASAYQPYGQPTANSQEYDRWAQQQRQGNSFDMSRGSKKKGCKRAALIALGVLLVIVLGVGIGLVLFMGGLDGIMGLGKNKANIEMALTDGDVGQPYYVLLIGNDSREGSSTSDAEWAGKSASGSDGQSDVLILARVDEKAKTVTLLSVPRDTPYKSSDGSWSKLKQVFEDKGANALIKAVSDISGVSIAHYAEIHMSGFMDLVDSIGGITVDVPNEITYHEALTSEEIHINAGTQHLNGAEAEVFARERKSYGSDQDMNRQSNVRNVVKAIFDQIKTKPAWELPEAITSCAKCVSTDLSSFELAQIFSAIGNPKMLSGTGPYDGDNNPFMGGQWCCYVDTQGWARVMGIVNSGGDPSSVSYSGDDVYQAGSR